MKKKSKNLHWSLVLSLFLLLGICAPTTGCRCDFDGRQQSTRPDISALLQQADRIADEGKKIRDESLYLSAEGIYLQALDIHPQDPVLLQHLAFYYISYSDMYWTGRPGRVLDRKAERLLRKAMEMEPDNPWRYMDLASLIDTPRLEKHREAEKLYNKALQIDPSLSFLQENLGICYFNQKKYGKAEQTLLEFIRTAEEKPSETDLIRAYEFLGKNYQAMGNLAEAQKALEKSAALYDENLMKTGNDDPWGCPYHSLGELYAIAGNGKMRDAICLKSADLQPNTNYIQANAALIAYRYGNFEKGMQYIDRALKVQGSDEYRVARGFLLLAMNRKAEANRIFAETATGFSLVHPSSWLSALGAQVGAGFALLADRNDLEAYEHFHRAIHGIQGRVMKKIIIDMGRGRRRVLHDPFETDEVGAFFIEMAYFGMGMTFSDRSLHQEAIGWFQKALAIQTENPAARLALAESLLSVDRVEEAKSLYRELLERKELRPELVDRIADGLGQALMGEGVVDQATDP